MQNNKSIVERTVIFIVFLNIFCAMTTMTTILVNAEPSSQQEQELLLLDALSKRLPSTSSSNFVTSNLNNYGSSNSIMDMLGRSNKKKTHK